MHFLIHGIGTAGDVLPFVGIGRVLRERGHRVTFMANDYFREYVLNAGLAFFSLGGAEEYLCVSRSPDLWHPSQSLKLIVQNWVLPHMRRTYSYIRHVCRTEEILLVGSGAAFGARLAQEKLGVRMCSAVLSPFMLPSVHDDIVFRGWSLPGWIPPAAKAWSHRLVDRVVDRVSRTAVDTFRSEIGLPPLKTAVRSWWFSPERVLALWPEWFAPRRPDWPSSVTAVDFPYYDGGPPLEPDRSSRVEAFLQSSDPFVVFARGSVRFESERAFQQLSLACERLNLRAVVLGGEAPTIQNTSQFAWFPYVPLSQVLRRASAIIHHGGIGTISHSLAAGLPQLAVPFGHDQFDNSARLQKLGVSRTLDRHRYTATALEQALGALLNGSGAIQRARALVTRCNPHTALQTACQIIESEMH